MDTYDVAVVGLGAVGSATAFQLARRGARVLGIDRFAPPHAWGSSHGGSRISREAIGEGKHLTPLARRSHVLWREIERETGAALFSATGLLVLSSPAKTSFTHVEDFFANTVAAAEGYGVAHELLDAQAIRDRFPQFQIRDDEIGYFEPGAGFVRPEACIRAQIELARKYGADLHLNERASGFAPGDCAVRIATDRDSYVARTLVIAAGPWLPELIGGPFTRLFRVYRQVQFWFAPADDSFRAERFPVFIWELSGRRQAIYGFPDVDGAGVKIATEQYDSATDPNCVERHVAAAECEAMHECYVAPFLPGLSAQCLRASACLYTVTADFGFVIDRHPASERVIVASCCSGHGFKHSAALGEALTELILDGRSRFDLSPFRLARLSAC